jgi:hypothetical protein
MESDLEKAREIVRKCTPFVGGDALLDSIVKVVAEGIALGREERTLAITAQII